MRGAETRLERQVPGAAKAPRTSSGMGAVTVTLAPTFAWVALVLATIG